MTERCLHERDLGSGSLTDAILRFSGFPFPTDGSITAESDQLFSDWIRMNGGQIRRTGRPVVLDALPLIVHRWHIALSDVGWSTLTLLPLLALDVGVLRAGVTIASLHGVLERLRQATQELSPDEIAIAMRLRDIGRTFSACTREQCLVGLTVTERDHAQRVVDKLVERGVIVEASGLLTVAW